MIRFIKIAPLIFCVLIMIFTTEIVVACSCGGTSSTSEAYQYSAAVFIGKVKSISRTPSKVISQKNPDGSVTVTGVDSYNPETVKIAVKKSFRGVNKSQIDFVMYSGNGCSYTFVKGESYLVFAILKDGKLEVNKCTRTRPVSKAGEAIKYIEGIISNRPQALIYGEVFRVITNKNGKRIALQVPFEQLQVIVRGNGQRYEITAEKFGVYEAVILPGAYEIWVERLGKKISQSKIVAVNTGESKRQGLEVKFE